MKSLRNLFNGTEYFFEGMTGSLLGRPVKEEERKKRDPLSEKAEAALKLVAEPFLLTARPRPELPERISGGVKFYARVLTWLCRRSFLLARLWGRIPLRCYPDAGVATLVYRKLYPGKQQKDLCLPRAFFARSASRNFKESGAMFIGAFLPSVQMHAWVIEDGMHADVFDNGWIDYAPVAVFE